MRVSAACSICGFRARAEGQSMLCPVLAPAINRSFHPQQSTAANRTPDTLLKHAVPRNPAFRCFGSHAAAHRSSAACRCSARAKGTPVQQQTPQWLQRSELIMGTPAVSQLIRSTVTVVGMGGVGSWCAGAFTPSYSPLNAYTAKACCLPRIKCNAS